jgi:organic anion transporter 4A
VGKLARALLALFRNVTYIFIQFASATESLVIVGVGAFLPKVVETQFLLSSSQASFLTGVSVIIGAAGGILLGGALSRKWTTLKCLRACVVVSSISMVLSVCVLIHCTPLSLVGQSHPYPLLNNSLTACSQPCNCSQLIYKPVCAPGGSTFPSVCSAGCQTSSSPSSYSNCSCLSSLADTVTDGRCREGCQLLPAFLIGLLLLMLATFAYVVPSTMITVRCVHDSQRSLAMGLGSAIYRAFGAIPGPLIVGAVLDNACILWQKNVSDDCIVK